MPLKSHTYATYANKFMCRYQITMLVCISHMNSMQPTMSWQALVYIHFTLLAYALEHICLPHKTYMSHYTSNIVYMQTPLTEQISQTKQWTATLFIMLKAFMCQQQICPSNATYANDFMCRYETTKPVYMYFIWTQCNEQCDHDHWHMYMPPYWYAPEQICLPHCIYVFHCTSTLVFI